MRLALTRSNTARSLTMSLALSLLCAPSAVLAQEAEAADEGASRFAGTWRYTQSAQHGAEVINRAVGHTVEPMNIFVRAIAAGRLRGKNPLVRRIAMTVNGDNVQVVFDGNRTYRAPMNQWRSHTFDGNTVRVQFRYRNGALVQLFRSDGGTRRNVYRLRANGTMSLSVTVQSPQLPRDMNYTLIYRR